MRSPELEASEWVGSVDGDRDAEAAPPATEETPPTDRWPYETNTLDVLATQPVSPMTTEVDLLHEATPFAASQYNQVRNRISIIGGSNDGTMLPICSCGFRFAPHRLGGNLIYPLTGSIVPEPGPTQSGGLSVLAEQLPIWDEEDLPVDVFVRDIGADGFLLTGEDQVLCLILRITEADEVQISTTMQFHLNLDFQTVFNQIVGNIRAIPQEEVRRLTHSHLFNHPNINISNTERLGTSSTRNPSFTATEQTPSAEEPESTTEASELSVELLNPPVVAGNLSPEEPTGINTESATTTAGDSPYFAPNTLVGEQSQPGEASSPIEETSHCTDTTSPKSPSTQPPLDPFLESGLPFGSTGGAAVSSKHETSLGFVYELPEINHPKTRWGSRATGRAPRKRTIAKKPEIFEWADKHRAFVVYYVEYGYLPSQVRRMFQEEFGTTPTHEEIRNMLEFVDERSGKVKTKQQFVYEVNTGVIIFNTLHCVPSGRTQIEPVTTPLRATHKNFVSFFHGLGIDKAVVHEIFETHYQGTVTTDQLEEYWRNPSTKERALRMEAARSGWLEYIKEGNIAYPENPAVQKNVRKALARARAAGKKEEFLEHQRRVDELEKKGVPANVNESTAGEQGGEKKADDLREQRDTPAERTTETVEKKADGKKKGRMASRGLRPQEDKERSRSPK